MRHMTATLQVAPRSASASALRADRKLPGIVYGPKQEPIQIEVDLVTFEKTLADAGESTILSLQGLDEEVEVLIHDVAFNAARGGVEHVDFYAIERGKDLTTNVALEFIDEAPAEDKGMTVNKVLYEVEVTCRPSNLPSHIDVSLASLETEEDQIMVSDLIVPEGVVIENEADTPVATVAAAREEEPEETEPVEVDMDAVEVEQKGKAEGDEEADAETKE